MIPTFDFSNIDQEKAWRKIFPEFSLTKKFHNSLYSDKNPGCKMYWNNNQLKLYDYGDDRFYGVNLIEAYQKAFNVNEHKAKLMLLEFESDHIQRQTMTQPKSRKTKVDTYFKAYSRSWEYHDQELWLGRYLFTKKDLEPDLEPCWYYTFYSPTFNSLVRIYSTPEKPIYMWTFPSGRQKVYSPYDKKLKWMGNATNEDVYFYSKGSKSFCLCSGSKDAKTVFKHSKHDTGALQGEKRFPPDHLIEVLKHYKEVIVSLDGDKDGTEWTHKVNDYLLSKGINSRPVVTPKIDKRKDWAEHLEHLKEKFPTFLNMYL